MAISKTALLRWLASEERTARNEVRREPERTFWRGYNLGQAQAFAMVHTWVQRPVKAKRKKVA